MENLPEGEVAASARGGGRRHADHSPVRHRQADVPPGRLRRAPAGVCGGEQSVRHRAASSPPPSPYEDSRSGVEGGAGVHRCAGSSGPGPQPFTCTAAGALLFFRDLRKRTVIRAAVIYYFSNPVFC